MRLSDLKQGQTGIIRQVGGGGQLRQHFLDMGLIQGTEITYMKAAPMGDPIEYRIWGYELTLRKDDGAKIEIELSDKSENRKEPRKTAWGNNRKRTVNNFRIGRKSELWKDYFV